MKTRLIFSLSALFVLALSSTASAHFPWLATDEDGKAIYFFGETVDDRTYKLPGSLAEVKVECHDAEGKSTTLTMEKVDGKKMVGLVSTEPVAPGSALTAHATYGIYHGSRLDYYTVYQGGKLPNSLEAYAACPINLPLRAKLVDTDKGVDVYVTWQDKPLADAEVLLFCSDGHEEAAGKTDAEGKISFNNHEVEDGLNAILVGQTVKDEQGKLNGETYKSAAHYLTVTFVDPEDFEILEKKK